MLTYGAGQPSLLVSKPSQPIYTISYRTNNGGGGGVLASNILTGPAAATYVTAPRNQIATIRALNSDSDNETRNHRVISRRHNSKKVSY